MTNIDMVKQGIRNIPGNRVFTARDINIPELTPKQIGNALRDISYVLNMGNGKYRIKGRKIA